MRKLTFGDLTPEFLKELYKLTTVDEIIEACKKKDLEVDEDAAAKLLDQFKRAAQLSEESLKNVVGGGKGYSGTRLLLSSIGKISEGRMNNCSDELECLDWVPCLAFCPDCYSYIHT